MGDFLRIILESIHFLWPLAIVHQYERGVYLVFGRVWKVVGPGLYPKVPWFTEIHFTSVAWEPARTGRCDITAKDNRTVTFDATAWIRVSDPILAYTLVHDYEQGMHSLLSSVLAENLADVEADRLSPEKRGRLNASLKGWVTKEAAQYGLEVDWVRFTSFVLAPRTYRVLTDQDHFV